MSEDVVMPEGFKPMRDCPGGCKRTSDGAMLWQVQECNATRLNKAKVGDWYAEHEGRRTALWPTPVEAVDELDGVTP